MQRTDYDFDVISGPSTPLPLPRQPAQPEGQAPREGEAPAAGAERRG